MSLLEPVQLGFSSSYLFHCNWKSCVVSVAQRKRPSLVQMMGLQSRSRLSARSKMGAKWLAKVKKGQVAPKGTFAIHTFEPSILDNLS